MSYHVKQGFVGKFCVLVDGGENTEDQANQHHHEPGNQENGKSNGKLSNPQHILITITPQPRPFSLYSSHNQEILNTITCITIIPQPTNLITVIQEPTHSYYNYQNHPTANTF